MKVLTVEHIVSCLRKRTIPLRQIAEESGVPKDTIRKLLNKDKTVRNPRIQTFQKLARYFEENAA